MDTYARNRWFFVAEGHISEGITWRHRYEYLAPIHNTGRNGGGGRRQECHLIRHASTEASPPRPRR